MTEHKVLTHTGRLFDLVDPKLSQVDINDISYSLSKQCRYNGHCHNFLSVAEHSVMVSHAVPPQLALQALFHDAAEAYIGDIATPVKAVLGDVVRKIEDKILATIYEALNIEYVERWASIIKDADTQALITEWPLCFPGTTVKLDDEVTRGLEPFTTLRPVFLSPEEARRAFMGRWLDLRYGTGAEATT